MSIRYIDFRPPLAADSVPQTSDPPVCQHIRSLMATDLLPAPDRTLNARELFQGTALELFVSLNQDPLCLLAFIDLTGIPVAGIAYEIDELTGRANPVRGGRAFADIYAAQCPAEAAFAVAEQVCRGRFQQPTEGEEGADEHDRAEARFRPGKMIVLLTDPPPPDRTPWKVGANRRLGSASKPRTG
ncbi:unnamed protein product [Gemmata massiliana]|uniref:Uncharacterized protein n=1 Tax=Gemmata massiliana TaxID=1210884 RepID=A0A6P2CRZ7_9BACT|nr:hypothetical protein [Gemmata massiliana]VTR91701.1 unnamed protein product [Gemmata massiliana]